MNPLLWPFIIVYGVFVVLSSIDTETWLRLLAALVLLWHPIHEQQLGFWGAFNRAVCEIQHPNCRTFLSRRQNALQATLLATVFPALALWGPWWAITFALAFYVNDRIYTHGKKSVPGGWSAVVGAIALLALLLSMGVPPMTLQSYAAVLAAGLAAGVALYVPWWMAYRKVRSR